MNPSPLRILILLTNHRPCSDLRKGIQAFSLTTPNWTLGWVNMDDPTHATVEEALRWPPDGIVVPTRFSRVPEAVRTSDIPTVYADPADAVPPEYHRVVFDEVRFGIKAAAFFHQHRFSHYALVNGPKPQSNLQKRAQGYRQALTKLGFTPHEFTARNYGVHPWEQNEDLDDWLLNLPKPIGVYCTQDVVALRILRQCERLHIGIPSEVSLLGSSNNPYLCEATRPFISSIHAPKEEPGFQAAKLLSTLIRLRQEGEQPEPVCIRVEPGEIVERQSTGFHMIPDPAIAKAANFLQDRALQGCTVPEAAQVAGINRRKLERGFQRHLKTSPLSFIQRVKIDHAKRLLTETDLQIGEIAEACALTEAYFSTLFGKLTGTTPTEYRRKYAPRDLFSKP